MNFGNQLRALIEEQGITQKELAGRLNIAPSTLGCYVQNTREPDFATLTAIANYFDVSIDYLLAHRTPQAKSDREETLLRIFRSLSDEQQELYLEQGKAFLRIQAREARISSGLKAGARNKVG